MSVMPSNHLILCRPLLPPDLFSEPLCGSFPGGGSGSGSGSGSGGGSSSGGAGAGSGDPSGQRPFSQVPLPAFSPSATSSQAATLQVKAPAASGPTPPRAPSGCEGKLGVALESLQGRRDLT